VDIIFRGRHTDVLDRFRKHATAKLAKIGKLDQKAIRVDVEVSAERNPRQSGRRERVELTISSRGPVIRAEAAAEDRYAALDLAVSKLESRLRRAGDRRKCRHGAHAATRLTDLPSADDAPPRRVGSRPEPAPSDVPMPRDGEVSDARSASRGAQDGDPVTDDIVPIEMEGDGPLVVREKFHVARPMAIDQALFEMELVGHDFFLFRDLDDGCPSVVYRRQGYQYGVIRLIEEGSDPASGRAAAPSAALGRTNGQSRSTAEVAAG
jgi:ribosomal subunit interface protein